MASPVKQVATGDLAFRPSTAPKIEEFHLIAVISSQILKKAEIPYVKMLKHF